MEYAVPNTGPDIFISSPVSLTTLFLLLLQEINSNKINTNNVFLIKRKQFKLVGNKITIKDPQMTIF